jgi:hypothetical protein
MENIALTEITSEDFKKFLQNINRSYITVDFEQIKKGKLKKKINRS